MQRALKKVQDENPSTKQVSLSPSTSSPITRMMMPRGAMAVTNPFTGNITYNPDVMEGQSPEEMEQTIAHELTHVRQTQNTPWWKTAANLFVPDEKVPAGIPQNSALNDPYQWRPREMEAFQNERDRAAKIGIKGYTDPVTGSRDLQLPPNRGIKTGPSARKMKQLTNAN